MTLPAELLKAYKETHYHIHSNPSFFLKIDTYSADLAELHNSLGVTKSAVITAWNPYSEMQSECSNSLRQSQLDNSVLSMGLSSLSALGQHPSGKWPAEKSLFIAGIELSDASELGVKFGQNAIVFSTVNSIPNIIVLV